MALLKPMLLAWLLPLAWAALSFDKGHQYTYQYQSEAKVNGIDTVNTKATVHIRSTSTPDTIQLTLSDIMTRSESVGEEVTQLPHDTPVYVTLTPDGSVDKIYTSTKPASHVYHKAIIAALSGSYKLGVEKYQTTDEDGLGHHSAIYNVLKRGDEHHFTKEKRHESVSNEDVNHVKLTKISSVTKDLLSVDVRESFQMKESKEFYQNTFRDENVVKPVVIQGDIHKFEVFSTSSLTLHNKEPASDVIIPFSTLKEDSLQINQEVFDQISKTKKSDLLSLEQYIHCLEPHYHQNVEAVTTEHSHCFLMLVELLSHGSESSLRRLAQEYLDPHQAVTRSRRLIMLDAICDLGTDVSQQIIVSTILRNPLCPEEYVERALSHVIAIPKPNAEMVSAIKFLARNPGSKHQSPVRSKALLMAGTTAKHLHLNNRHDERDDVIDFLTSHVDHHTRKRRSMVGEKEKKGHEKHLITLIEALGNTGHGAVRDHVLQHLTEEHPSAVRRAAAHATRGYTCSESVDALKSVLNSETSHDVKRAAHRALQDHPLRDELHPEPDTVSLATLRKRAITLPDIDIKDIIEYLEDMGRLNFSLKAPAVDWTKSIGVPDMGATFGVVARNELNVDVGGSFGHMEIDVLNEAWLSAVIGLIDKNIDVVRGYTCFHGEIKYDFNPLKEIDADFYQEIASKYDGVLNDTINFVQDSTSIITEMLEKVTENYETFFHGLFGELRDLLLALPFKIRQLSPYIRKVIKRLNKYHGIAWSDSLKKVVFHMDGIVEDAKRDIHSFMDSLADGVTVSLPYSGKLVKDSIKAVQKSLTKSPEAPKQVMGNMISASMKIQTAVGLLLATKSQILANSFFISGHRPYWMNFGNEVKLLVSEILKARDVMVERLQEHAEGLDEEGLDEVTFRNLENAKTMAEQELDALEEVLETVKPVANSFIQLYNLAEPLLDKMAMVMTTIDMLKEGYGNLKSKLEKVTGMVGQLFGPKLHKRFPTEPRQCIEDDGPVAEGDEDPCGCGRFPSNVGDRYRDGISLLAGIGATLVAPFGGYAFHGPQLGYEDDVVVLKVTDIGMKGRYILMHHVEVNSTIATADELFGKKVSKGQVLGHVTQSPDECPGDNFIHFVLLKGVDIQDPSPILERTHLPIPGFDTICDDYRLVVLGSTISEGALTDIPGMIYDEIKRRMHKPIKAVSAEEEAEEEEEEKNLFQNYEIEPIEIDIPEVFTKDDWMNGINKTMNETKGEFLDMITDSFLGAMGGSLPQNFKIRETFTILENSNATKELDALKGVLKLYVEQTTKQHCIVPSRFSEPRLRWFMSRQRIDTKEDHYQLTKRAYTLGASSIECDNLVVSLAESRATHCQPHGDCLGAVCCSKVTYGHVQGFEKTEFRADFCSNILIVDLDDYHVEVSLLDASRQSVALPIREPFKNQTMKLIVEVTPEDVGPPPMAGDSPDDEGPLDTRSVIISFGYQICIPHYGGCLPETPIITDATLTGTCLDDQPRRPSSNGSSYSDELLDVTLGELQEELMYSDVGLEPVLEVITGVRTILLESAIEGIYLEVQADNEFPDIENSCKEGKINFPSKSVTFFDITSNFMAGPIPVQFQFRGAGAFAAKFNMKVCMMSMEATGELTPAVGVSVIGFGGVGVGIFRAGIEMKGDLINTAFPSSANVGFSNFPLAVGIGLDLITIPLKVTMKVVVEFDVKLVSVTFLDYVVFTYSLPPLKYNVFQLEKAEDDPTPPKFGSNTFSREQSEQLLLGNTAGGEMKDPRGTVEQCELWQIPGRPYTQPAFGIEVSVYDDQSQYSLYYSIGTYPGGRNIKNRESMGGMKVEIEDDGMPSGQPLYWTVEATNTGSETSTLTCMLPTFDKTPPEVFVRDLHSITSYSEQLFVIVHVNDDTPIEPTLMYSLSLSPGGEEILPWTVLNITEDAERKELIDFDDPLLSFTPGINGKISIAPTVYYDNMSLVECAVECKDAHYSVFDYNLYTGTCLLYEDRNDEPVSASLRWVHHETVQEAIVLNVSTHLVHNTMYFWNVRVRNILGYETIVTSDGVLVDTNPPSPQNILRPLLDELRWDGCEVAPLNNCDVPVTRPNHRFIKDSKSCHAVWHGLDGEILYTRNRLFIPVSFAPFTDIIGVKQYLWSVGTSPCGSDVLNATDPHEGVAEPLWNYDGVYNVQLEDGEYYSTVQAIDAVEFGGSMLTTVCHMTPLVVDTVAPLLQLDTMRYSEGKMILGFTASDSSSGVSTCSVYVGRQAGWSDVCQSRVECQGGVVECTVPDGLEVWVTVQVLDKAINSISAVFPHSILVDTTPPVLANVTLGTHKYVEQAFWSRKGVICAFWGDVEDEHSGIASTTIELISWEKTILSESVNKEQSICWHVADIPPVYRTLSARLTVRNKMGLTSTVSSNIVKVDETPPIAGKNNRISLPNQKRVPYHYHPHLKPLEIEWRPFTDRESDIEEYIVSVRTADLSWTSVARINVGKATSAKIKTSHWHPSHTQVLVSIEATNGAGLSIVRQLEMIVVLDTAPPALDYIKLESEYTKVTDAVTLSWLFKDAESGVRRYKIVLYEVTLDLQYTQIWPVQKDYEMLPEPGCRVTSNGADYRGYLYMTKTRKTCQAWSAQYPHKHSRTPEQYPDAGLENNNFCRNPDGEGHTWCYTTDPNVRWEYCDIPNCAHRVSEPYTIKGQQLALKSGSHYVVSVTAEDWSGLEFTAYSSPLTVDTTPPPPPASLSFEDGVILTSESNIALFKTVTMSSVYGNYVPENAVDGISDWELDKLSMAHTLEEFRPWIKVDLDAVYVINTVVVANRMDCCKDRIDGAEVTVLKQGKVVKSCGVIEASWGQFYTLKCEGVEGDEVKLQLPGKGIINVMEIMVLGASKDIKMWWAPAQDPESGIQHYEYAIGTGWGLYDVVGWTVTEDLTATLEVHSKSSELHGSVRSVNGLSVQSGILSAPVLLHSEYPGLIPPIKDGRDPTTDLEEQVRRDVITGTLNKFQFNCNVTKIAWSYSDSKMSAGLQFLPVFMRKGVDHITLSTPARLAEGRRYYIVVKGSSPCGNHAERWSDGVVVNSKRAKVSLVNIMNRVLTTPNSEVIYTAAPQAELVSASWLIHRANGSPSSVEYAILKAKQSVNHVRWIPTTANHVHFQMAAGVKRFSILVKVTTQTNLTTISSFPLLLRDITPPPVSSEEKCPEYYAGDQLAVDVTDLYDLETPMTRIEGWLGTDWAPLPVDQYVMSVNTSTIKQAVSSTVNIIATNLVGLAQTYSCSFTMDRTPPVAGYIRVLDNNRRPSRCFASRTVHVQWSNFVDTDSFIKSYQVDFTLSWARAGYDKVVKSVATKGDADEIAVSIPSWLPLEELVVRVTAFNGAGLSVSVTSDSVILVTDKSITVTDGGLVDVDYVAYTNKALAGIQTSLCPMQELSWSLMRNDYLPITELQTTAIDNLYNFTIDLRDVTLHDDSKYFFHIEALVDGDRMTARSNGFTVKTHGPVAGVVLDGPTQVMDIDHQSSLSVIHATWTEFSTRSGDDVLLDKYLVSLGTTKGGDDVVKGFNVGKERSVTLSGLSLTKGKRYYVLVEGIAKNGLSTKAVSDGVKVGVQGNMRSGEVTVNPYQRITTSIAASWSGFDGGASITGYEVAISTIEDQSWCNIACPAEEELDHVHPCFDIVPLTNVGLETAITWTDLNLTSAKPYYVTVRASDSSLGCSWSVSQALFVDTSPPVIDHVLLENNSISNPLIYVAREKELELTWDQATDDESGISGYEVRLLNLSHCDAEQDIGTIRNEDDYEKFNVMRTDGLIGANFSIARFVKLDLIPHNPYFISISTTNRAGLTTYKRSSPVLVDRSPPVAGDVYNGVWGNDIKFFSNLTQLRGAVTLANTFEQLMCPHKEFTFSTTEPMWYPVIDVESGTRFTSEMITDHKGGLKVTIQRDLQTHAWNSGAIGVNLPRESLRRFQVTVQSARGSFNTLVLLSNNLGKGSSPSSTRRGTSFGVVLPGEARDGKWYIVFWYRHPNINPEAQEIGIEFDPTEQLNRYEIRERHKDVADGSTKIDVEVWINNVFRSVVSEVPLLKNPRLVVSVVAVGAIPDVTDPFDVPTGFAYLRRVSVTDTENKSPCIHGNAFYEFESPITEVHVGIGSSKEWPDVLDYQLYHKICSPCSTPCYKYECDASCNTADLQQLDIHLTGLDLPAGEVIETVDGEGRHVEFFKPATYYLFVKAINKASLASTSVSNGIVADTDPPVPISLVLTDPSISTQTEQKYLGNSNMFGAFWEFEDPTSEVVGYEWCVGDTKGSSNLQNWTYVGTANSATYYDDLQEGQTYFVSIRATNGAGLSTVSHSKGITVDTKEPNINKITAVLNGTNDVCDVLQNCLVDKETLDIMDSIDRFYLTYNNTKTQTPNNVKFYGIQIGSSEGGEDLLQRTLISDNEVGEITIKDGAISFGDGIFKRISEFKPFGDSADFGETYFKMEPGRQIHFTLHAVSYGHLYSYHQVRPTLVHRTQDVVTNIRNSVPVNISLSEDIYLEVGPGMASEGFIAGVLAAEDFNCDYGSAASDSYIPYIQQPSSLLNATIFDIERELVGRIVNVTDVSVFVSPTGRDIGILKIHFHYTEPIADDTELKMVYWDVDSTIWRLVTCSHMGLPDIIHEGSDVLVWACRRSLTNTLLAHATYSYSPGSATCDYALCDPTHFHLVVLLKEPVNTAPVLQSLSFDVMEDEVLEYSFTSQDHHDAEGDEAMFSVVVPPSHGQVTLYPNGRFTYSPKQHVSGTDTFTVQLMEMPDDLNPQRYSTLATNATMTITIHPYHDPPTLTLYNQAHQTISKNTPVASPVYAVLEDADVGETFKLLCYPLESCSVVESSEDLAVTFPSHAVYKVTTEESNVTLVGVDATLLYTQIIEVKFSKRSKRSADIHMVPSGGTSPGSSFAILFISLGLWLARLF